MNRTHSLILALVLMVSWTTIAAAQTITSYWPPKPAAGIAEFIYIYGTGIGSIADVAKFPDGTEVGATSAGSGWIRVRVPQTWSGQLQVLSATTLTWSNTLDFEVSYNWTQTQWNPADLPLQWYMNSAGAPGCTSSETSLALLRGYDAWECASDVSTTYAGTTSTLPNNSADGINVQGWTSSGWSSGTIAVCSWRYWIASGDIIEFDIGYNSQHFNWACDGSATAMDVGNIGTHEMGHSIGLADLYGGDDFDETMYGFGANGEVIRRSLELDDIEGAEYMYPRGGRPNLTWSTPTGWAHTLVPRNTNDATTSSASLPAVLNGNTTSYMNVASRNNGLDCAAWFGPHRFYVDDVWTWSLTWAGVWGTGVDLMWTNLGSVVRGGRHTLRVDYDIDDEIVEGSEVDNTRVVQYAFSPLGILDQTPITRSAPPDEGTGSNPNSDGYAFTGGWWGGVGMLPTATGDDYDLYLYDGDNSSTTGFSNLMETSFTGGSGSEFVLWNGNQIGNGVTRNVGMVEYSASTGASAQVEACNPIGGALVPSTVYGEMSTAAGSMSSNGVLRVYEVWLGATGVTYGFTLENLSGTANLNMSLYDAAGDYFGKWDYEVASTSSGANEYFEFEPAAAGYFAVVIWKADHTDHGLANSFNLHVGRALSNLDNTSATGSWDAPLVTRNDATATVGSVVQSPTLDGNTTNTYLSWATEFSGTSAIPSWTNQMWLDGLYLTNQTWSGASVPGFYVNLNWGPFNVRGGRHTISQQADPAAAIAELDETDNVYTAQWVWSPQPLTKDNAVARSKPPHPGIGVHPNSDGFSFVPVAGHSWVTALAPRDPSDDYDLRVYDDYSGSTSGFSNTIGYGGYGGNTTEIVVGHFSAGYSTVYPAAIEWSSSAAGQVLMDQSDTQGHRGTENATFYETLGADSIVDVYGALLVSGETYSVRLERLSGTDDIAFAVFPSGGVHTLSTALAYGNNVAAHMDYVEFEATGSSWFPIVVYRTDGTEATEGVDYVLSWTKGSLTPVPEITETEFSFRGGFPNPSPGNTMLEFSTPVGGPVRMTIHNVRGQRVRSLVTETMPAGRHSVHWDGRDSRGQSVASGAYWVRLEAAGLSKTQKITVLR